MIKLINISHLRYISLIEGISYLLLLFIGMPLKYGLGLFLPNKLLGMIHGILTIVFCVILFFIWKSKKLTHKWCIGIFVASLIPFAALFVESKLKKIS
jgi:integral membrane protein